MYTQEFLDHYALWELENHSVDWYCYRTPDAKRLVQERAASLGGYPSISAFIIAFDRLRAEGTLKPVRKPRAAEADTPGLTAEQYRSLPTAVVIRKYQSDSDFKLDVDRLIAEGEI